MSSIKLNPTYDATHKPVPQLYELIVQFREDGPPYTGVEGPYATRMHALAHETTST